jgi:hypothetical protein
VSGGSTGPAGEDVQWGSWLDSLFHRGHAIFGFDACAIVRLLGPDSGKTCEEVRG